MGEAFVWWLVLEVLGVAALPIAAVVLRTLPDRGYSAAKTLGLLLTGWLAYTLSMMQMATFTRGLLFVSLLIMAGFSGWLLWRDNRALLVRLRGLFAERRFWRYILAAEALFTLTFAFWALMRAYSPDIFGTEKFMDFGFLNSVMRSQHFPPNDMWLAGYPINYYYFGYVLMGSLSLLAGVPSSIGYNLANATIPALLAIGTFGLIYNLINLSRLDAPEDEPVERLMRSSGVPRRRSRVTSSQPSGALPVRRTTSRPARPAVATETTVATTRQTSVAVAKSPAVANGHAEEQVPQPPPVVREDIYEHPEPEVSGGKRSSLLAPVMFGLLAALMVIAMGHLTTLFAVKRTDSVNMLEGNGWRFCFMCQTPATFSWWDPSRVIKDYRVVEIPGQQPTKQASGVDAINEFPAFSFVLADLHPHVMALPLWPLALSFALALARRRPRREGSWRDGLPRGWPGWLTFVVAGIAIGALYTTNTWDYPTFLLIALAGLFLPHLAYRAAYRAREDERSRWRWLRAPIVESVLLVTLSFLTFALFHLTFKSLVGGQPAQIPENLANIPILGWLLQRAGGLLLVNTWDKGIVGFLVIFGIFLIGIVGWLLYELATVGQDVGEEQRRNRTGIITAVVTVVSLLLAVVWRFPMLAFCLPIVVLSLLLIWRSPDLVVRNLVLFTFALATFIALAIEVVYLRDVFNDRQNTIFKFYYQIWVLFAVIAAYGVWRVLSGVMQPREQDLRAWSTIDRGATVSKSLATVWAGIFTLLVASGLMYTVYAALQRTGQGNAVRGLDGVSHLRFSAPGDYAALQWLAANAQPDDRVIECCRDEYNNPGHAGRVSAYTGVPTLISWGGHEAQWRGGQPELLAEAGTRRQVVNEIYTARGGTMTVQELLSLLQTYSVDYIFVGATERGQGSAAGAYPEERVTPEAEALYRQVLAPVFTSGETVIYKVPPAAGGATGSP